MLKVKIILVIFILILIFVPAVESLEAEVLTRNEIDSKISEGWNLWVNTMASGSIDADERILLPWGGTGYYESTPVEGKQSTLIVVSIYNLQKKESTLFGVIAYDFVHLKIYKNDVEVISSYGWTDSNGTIKFPITFKEPGYYSYKIDNNWDENVKIKKIDEKYFFYVKASSTPTPVPSTPTPTSTPTQSPKSSSGFEVILVVFVISALVSWRR